MPIVIEALKANPQGIIARDLIAYIWESKKLKRFDNIGVDRLAMWMRAHPFISGVYDGKAGRQVYRWVGEDA